MVQYEVSLTITDDVERRGAVSALRFRLLGLLADMNASKESLRTVRVKRVVSEGGPKN